MAIWYLSRPDPNAESWRLDLSQTACNIETLRSSFFGKDYPDQPVDGQLWVKEIEPDDYELYIFRNGTWRKLIDRVDISSDDTELNKLVSNYLAKKWTDGVNSLSLYQRLSEKNQPNGYLGLDPDGKIPSEKFQEPITLPGGVKFSVKSISSNYNITINDSVLVVNAETSEVYLTLPPASDCRGEIFYIIKVDNSANSVILSSDQLISGMSSLSITSQYGYEKVISDGNTFYRIT